MREEGGVRLAAAGDRDAGAADGRARCPPAAAPAPRPNAARRGPSVVHVAVDQRDVGDVADRPHPFEQTDRVQRGGASGRPGREFGEQRDGLATPSTATTNPAPGSTAGSSPSATHTEAKLSRACGPARLSATGASRGESHDLGPGGRGGRRPGRGGARRPASRHRAGAPTAGRRRRTSRSSVRRSRPERVELAGVEQLVERAGSRRLRAHRRGADDRARSGRSVRRARSIGADSKPSSGCTSHSIEDAVAAARWHRPQPPRGRARPRGWSQVRPRYCAVTLVRRMPARRRSAARSTGGRVGSGIRHRAGVAAAAPLPAAPRCSRR